MRQLHDVRVDGMALVRRPANKKRFLTKKSEEAAVANDPAEHLQAPSPSVTDAIDAIKLSKGESADGHEALHGAAHLLAGRQDLSEQDFVAFAKALGYGDIVKAKDKSPMAEAEEDEDEGDEDEEEEAAEAEKPKAFDKKKKNPFAKSEAAPASVGEEKPMQAEAKEAREFVSKSEHEQLIERLTKSELELADIRGKEALRLEKSANEEAYGHLEVDHDALADVTMALRKSDEKKLDALATILKAANEQVRVAKASGGSPFRPQALRGGIAKSGAEANGRFQQLVADYQKANPGHSASQAVTAVAKSAEGLEAYRASKGEF